MAKKNTGVAGDLTGLRRGKRITIYWIGSSAQEQTEWRTRCYFYGWEGKQQKRQLLYRQERAGTYGAVQSANLKMIDRIEEGWAGEEDVRARPHREDTKQVNKFKEVAAEAEVKVIVPKGGRPRLKDSQILEAIEATEAGMTMRETQVLADMGYKAVSVIRMAIKGRWVPSYGENARGLFDRATKLFNERKPVIKPERDGDPIIRITARLAELQVECETAAKAEVNAHKHWQAASAVTREIEEKIEKIESSLDAINELLGDL